MTLISQKTSEPSVKSVPSVENFFDSFKYTATFAMART